MPPACSRQLFKSIGRSIRMRMRSRFLPVSILVLLFIVSLFVFTPRSQAVDPSQSNGIKRQSLKAAVLNRAGGNNGVQSNAGDKEPQTPPAGAGQDRPGRPDQQVEIKPYEKVITKEAKSDEGVFTVHTVKEKVYYEIPKSELGKEFLWVSQIARTTLGAGYGGQGARNPVRRWGRKNNRILLGNVSFEGVAEPQFPGSR